MFTQNAKSGVLYHSREKPYVLKNWNLTVRGWWGSGRHRPATASQKKKLVAYLSLLKIKYIYIYCYNPSFSFGPFSAAQIDVALIIEPFLTIECYCGVFRAFRLGRYKHPNSQHPTGFRCHHPSRATPRARAPCFRWLPPPYHRPAASSFRCCFRWAGPYGVKTQTHRVGC